MMGFPDLVHDLLVGLLIQAGTVCACIVLWRRGVGWVGGYFLFHLAIMAVGAGCKAGTVLDFTALGPLGRG